MTSDRKAREIAARILEGALSPPPTFDYENVTHVVEEYIRLPKKFHDKGSRLAPIQIIARTGEQVGARDIGVRAIVYSGKWERFVTHERGFGLTENPAPKEDVWYESTGTLRCHPSVDVAQAPQIAAAWLGTICSIVQERSPTEGEQQELLTQNISLEHVGFFHARALDVRPKWHFLRHR